MIDQHVLASRLSALEGYRAKLESFRRFERQEFLEDEDLHQLAARYLQLACECVLDLCQHLIAAKGFRQPGDYKEAIQHELDDLAEFSARFAEFLEEQPEDGAGS